MRKGGAVFYVNTTAELKRVRVSQVVVHPDLVFSGLRTLLGEGWVEVGAVEIDEKPKGRNCR